MKIQVFPLMYQNKKRIGIHPLGFDRAFPLLMKKIPGSRWTPIEKCWHIPYEQDAYSELKRLFGEGQVIILQQRPLPRAKKRNNTPKADYSKLIYKEDIIRLEERLRLQRYSYSTVKTYKNFFIQFLVF
ncbi:MAG: hypothetical protein R2828_02265 [Saprospiraceae bacterium]